MLALTLVSPIGVVGGVDVREDPKVGVEDGIELAELEEPVAFAEPAALPWLSHVLRVVGAVEVEPAPLALPGVVSWVLDEVPDEGREEEDVAELDEPDGAALEVLEDWAWSPIAANKAVIHRSELVFFIGLDA